MKRGIAGLIILTMLFACAAAEGCDKAALTNPEARYTDVYFEETDGSEIMIFSMLDAMNDEAAEIEANGSLIVDTNVKGLFGVNVASLRQIFQQSEFGRTVVNIVNDSGIDNAYITLESADYLFENGQLASATEESPMQDDFDAYWESYHFPYGPLDTLNGIRQDENGYTYYLIKSSEDMSFEFVTGEGMKIEELRIYERNAEILTLSMVVRYSTGAALTIPYEMLDQIREARQEPS